MQGAIELLARGGDWQVTDGASADEISSLERATGLRLPHDYRTTLEWSNGGSGQVGRLYLTLWSTDEIPESNAGYQIAKYLPGVLAIGSDGGPTCFALDYRSGSDDPPLIQVPFGDLDPASVVQLGPTFSEGLERAVERANAMREAPARARVFLRRTGGPATLAEMRGVRGLPSAWQERPIRALGAHLASSDRVDLGEYSLIHAHRIVETGTALGLKLEIDGVD